MLMMIYVDVYMIVLGMPDVRQPTVKYLLNLFSRAPYRQINCKSIYMLYSLFAHSEIITKTMPTITTETGDFI